MKLTNKHNIPDIFVQLVKNDTYSMGSANYSATKLISPPRIHQLRSKHWEEIEIDVADELWKIFGKLIHDIMERALDLSVLAEQRFYATLMDQIISGQIDVQKIGGKFKIHDYKFTSSYAAMDPREEWEAQLNIYDWLVKKNHPKAVIDEISIFCIIRDWSRNKAEQDPTYPQAPVVVLPMKRWGYKKTERYIKERMSLHIQAEEAIMFGDDLPECTAEERWEKDPSYAVHSRNKEGKLSKRALRVFDDDLKAKEFINNAISNKPLEVVFRPGESVRCAGNYCGVSAFCDQYKRILER